MNELILKRNFSKVAASYDNFAYLQKEIGLNLIKKMAASCRPFKILDIGTGTGWLTGQLKTKFPNAKFFGIDFAEGMIVYANKKKLKCNFLVSDALGLPFKDRYFDILISNATYQLVDNYKQAFSQVRRVLKKNGIFYFSCFGSKTLVELRQAINQGIINFKLPRKENILSGLLDSGFKNIDIKIYSKKEYFKNAFDLVKWLKAIGANNLSKPQFFTKHIWQEINKKYLSNFSDKEKIFATFEVFEVKCL
ncbi:MAG: methyltransferase domain-containing protein [Candidatus Omnitrophota bacterium]